MPELLGAISFLMDPSSYIAITPSTPSRSAMEKKSLIFFFFDKINILYESSAFLYETGPAYSQLGKEMRGEFIEQIYQSIPSFFPGKKSKGLLSPGAESFSG